MIRRYLGRAASAKRGVLQQHAGRSLSVGNAFQSIRDRVTPGARRWPYIALCR